MDMSELRFLCTLFGQLCEPFWVFCSSVFGACGVTFGRWVSRPHLLPELDWCDLCLQTNPTCSRWVASNICTPPSPALSGLDAVFCSASSSASYASTTRPHDAARWSSVAQPRCGDTCRCRRTCWGIAVECDTGRHV
uniref:Uncharacterized protein n=1 Tax=Cacopsylla melanoneura TaxID=428564 RepID=A0A8D8W0S9_9HEMI